MAITCKSCSYRLFRLKLACLLSVRAAVILTWFDPYWCTSCDAFRYWQLVLYIHYVATEEEDLVYKANCLHFSPSMLYTYPSFWGIKSSGSNAFFDPNICDSYLSRWNPGWDRCTAPVEAGHSAQPRMTARSGPGRKVGKCKYNTVDKSWGRSRARTGPVLWLVLLIHLWIVSGGSFEQTM